MTEFKADCLNPDRVPALAEALKSFSIEQLMTIGNALEDFLEFDEEGISGAFDAVIAITIARQAAMK